MLHTDVVDPCPVTPDSNQGFRYKKWAEKISIIFENKSLYKFSQAFTKCWLSSKRRLQLSKLEISTLFFFFCFCLPWSTDPSKSASATKTHSLLWWRWRLFSTKTSTDTGTNQDYKRKGENLYWNGRSRPPMLIMSTSSCEMSPRRYLAGSSNHSEQHKQSR